MIVLLVRAAACVLGLLVAVAACQPVDDLDELEDPAAEGGQAGEEDRRGAPATGAPGTLSEALARADAEAARWQGGARLAEAAVEVDERGSLAAGRLTYLAPEADRFLAVAVTEDGLREERPMLDALDLTPIPAAALDALPPLPEGVREPAELVEAAQAAFVACGVDGPPATVLYASGAPLAWDPDRQAWADALDWAATVTNEAGDGAVLDPVTGEGLDCLGGAA